MSRFLFEVLYEGSKDVIIDLAGRLQAGWTLEAATNAALYQLDHQRQQLLQIASNPLNRDMIDAAQVDERKA